MEEQGWGRPSTRFDTPHVWFQFDGRHFHTMTEVERGWRYSLILYGKSTVDDAPPPGLRQQPLQDQRHRCPHAAQGWVRGASGSSRLVASVIRSTPPFLAARIAECVAAVIAAPC